MGFSKQVHHVGAQEHVVCVFSIISGAVSWWCRATFPKKLKCRSAVTYFEPPSFRPFPWLGFRRGLKRQDPSVVRQSCPLYVTTAGSLKPSHLPWRFHPHKQSLPSRAHSLSPCLAGWVKCSCHLTLPGTLQQCVVERNQALLSWERHRN